MNTKEVKLFAFVGGIVFDSVATFLNSALTYEAQVVSLNSVAYGLYVPSNLVAEIPRPLQEDILMVEFSSDKLCWCNEGSIFILPLSMKKPFESRLGENQYIWADGGILITETPVYARKSAIWVSR